MNRFTILALFVLTVPVDQAVQGPAGTYTVQTTGPTTVTSGQGWVRIEWEADATPKPPEPAKPTEPPVEKPPVVAPPAPGPATSVPTLTGPVWALAVYSKPEVENYPPKQQDLLASATIGPALKALGISWQPRKVDDPVLKGWRDDAVKQGLPALVVIGDAGKQAYPFPLPADEQAMLALAKKIRGQ